MKLEIKFLICELLEAVFNIAPSIMYPVVFTGAWYVSSFGQCCFCCFQGSCLWVAYSLTEETDIEEMVIQMDPCDVLGWFS